MVSTVSQLSLGDKADCRFGESFVVWVGSDGVLCDMIQRHGQEDEGANTCFFFAIVTRGDAEFVWRNTEFFGATFLATMAEYVERESAAQSVQLSSRIVALPDALCNS